jgi:hypothetical protein
MVWAIHFPTIALFLSTIRDLSLMFIAVGGEKLI